MGEILPNNSYVDHSLVRQGETDVIICHTDCCNNSNISGEWFFPNETSLPDTDVSNTNTNTISQIRRSSFNVDILVATLDSVLTFMSTGGPVTIVTCMDHMMMS